MLMNLIYQKTIVLTVHLNFFFYFDFWEFIFYLKISNFHFLWKKKFREIAPKLSKKKCWHTVQKSKKRKTVQAYFII